MMYQVMASGESHPNELDLFAIPDTQASYEKMQWVDYRPISQLKDNAPVEFVIPASGSQYINLKQTYLYLNAKVLTDTGRDLDLDTKVSPINNILHSLWSQVDVLIQQKLISPSTHNYGYKALIETLLMTMPKTPNCRPLAFTRIH